MTLLKDFVYDYGDNDFGDKYDDIDKNSIDLKDVTLKSFKRIDENAGSNLKYPKGLTYSWENINIRVSDKSKVLTGSCCKNKSEKKQILDNVSGIAKPGEMLAIMGASGSGKTTLLDTLSLRTKLKVRGDLRVNGHAVTSIKQLSFISAYVLQEDLFFDTLTVNEHLTFHAMLRLSKNMTTAEREDRVKKVLNDLNLVKCENTLIGNPERGIKGISNGEKRRLGVATELLTDASLLMADEPTSGLDSFMAVAIIECLKKLAKQGKTVICTIHQPSSDIFQMFDKLYLLAEGRLAYTGSLPQALDFFNSQQLPCPKNYNPGDFYIQKLAIVPTKKEECLQKVTQICDNFKASQYHLSMQTDLKRINFAPSSKDEFKFGNEGDNYTVGFCTQLRYLFWRSGINATRDKISTIVRGIQNVFFAIIFGLIYYKQNNTEDSLRNINGVLYMCLINTTMLYLMTTCITFSFEIKIILKEHINGMYRMLSYYLAKVVTELPFNMLFAFLFLTILYWMANLNNAVDRYFICAAIIIILANIAIAFGGMISVFTPDDDTAIKVSNALMMFINIFGGYYLKSGTAPSWLNWLQYVSWLSYANELLTVNQWDGVVNITCTTTNQPFCYTGGFTGNMILNQLSYTKDNFGMDFGLLVAFFFLFRIISYFGLLVRARLNR